MSDAAYAAALHASVAEYTDFKAAWLKEHGAAGAGAQGSGGLSIPWLPSGFDLEAQLMGGNDAPGPGPGPGAGREGSGGLAYDGRT